MRSHLFTYLPPLYPALSPIPYSHEPLPHPQPRPLLFFLPSFSADPGRAEQRDSTDQTSVRGHASLLRGMYLELSHQRDAIGATVSLETCVGCGCPPMADSASLRERVSMSVSISICKPRSAWAQPSKKRFASRPQHYFRATPHRYCPFSSPRRYRPCKTTSTTLQSGVRCNG